MRVFVFGLLHHLSTSTTFEAPVAHLFTPGWNRYSSVFQISGWQLCYPARSYFCCFLGSLLVL